MISAWEKALVNNARLRVEIAQIYAELPHDGHAIEPASNTQVLHRLEPALYKFGSYRFPWFQFSHQETIQVAENLSVTLTLTAEGASHLPECLETGGNRTSEYTCRHGSPLFRPRHNYLPEHLEVSLGIDKSGIQAAVPQDIGNCFHR